MPTPGTLVQLYWYVVCFLVQSVFNALDSTRAWNVQRNTASHQVQRLQLRPREQRKFVQKLAVGGAKTALIHE